MEFTNENFKENNYLSHLDPNTSKFHTKKLIDIILVLSVRSMKVDILQSSGINSGRVESILLL